MKKLFEVEDPLSPVQPVCLDCKGKKLLLLEVLDTNVKVYCTHCGTVQYLYLPFEQHAEVKRK